MSNKGKKKCRSCKTYFTPTYSTLQIACSPSCALAYSKQKKAKENKENKAAIKELEQLRKQKKQSQKLSYQIEQTKKAVHEYIRLRDKGKPCITCPSLLFSDYDAGHYYHGTKSNALRFDFDNIHGQCKRCNQRNYGMFETYTLTLPKRIGETRFNALKANYNLSQKYIHKWSREELKDIRTEARLRIKELHLSII